MHTAFRRHSGEAALARVLRSISLMGLDSQIDTTAFDPGAAFVTLLRDGTAVARGIGKGQTVDALAGAHFEALEHYALDLAAADQTVNSQRMSSLALIQEPALHGDRAIGLLAECDEIHLNVRKFSTISGTGHIFYPDFLVNPRSIAGDTAYCGLERYSSNNGTAIGLSFEEAILHGINEVVERDLFSRMLASGTFLDPVPVCMVDPATLPIALKRSLDIAQSIVGRQLVLLLISLPDELPTFVTLSASEDDQPIWGAGTSLDGWHAAKRAIDECIQSALSLAKRPDMRDAQAMHRRRVAGVPSLSRISCLRWSTLAAHVNLLTMSFAAVATNGFPNESRTPLDSPSSHLASTLTVARRSYSGIFGATIARFPDDITAVQVVIPEADNFFLVLSGVPVIPSIRHCGKIRDQKDAKRLTVG